MRFGVLERLWMIGLMAVILMSSSRALSGILVLLGVNHVLRRRYRAEWQKVCSILSGK